jgi:hypothetical protein
MKKYYGKLKGVSILCRIWRFRKILLSAHGFKDYVRRGRPACRQTGKKLEIDVYVKMQVIPRQLSLEIDIIPHEKFCLDKTSVNKRPEYIFVLSVYINILHLANTGYYGSFFAI